MSLLLPKAFHAESSHFHSSGMYLNNFVLKENKKGRTAFKPVGGPYIFIYLKKHNFSFKSEFALVFKSILMKVYVLKKRKKGYCLVNFPLLKATLYSYRYSPTSEFTHRII